VSEPGQPSRTSSPVHSRASSRGFSRLRLYGHAVAIQLASQLEYRSSFWLMLLGQVLTSFGALLGVWFMMERFHSVAGFTQADVLLCFASVLMAFSLAETFFRGFDQFPALLADGRFDRMLLRPAPLILQVLTGTIEFTRFGRLVQGFIVFCWALPRVAVVWTPGHVAVLALMLLMNTFVFACLFVLYAGICFFTIEGLEFMNIFTDGGREFGAYPYAIYGKRVLQILTCLVPLALVQYYPLLWLTGRSTSILHALAPLGALFFILPTALVWRLGLRRYRSTGS